MASTVPAKPLAAPVTPVASSFSGLPPAPVVSASSEPSPAPVVLSSVNGLGDEDELRAVGDDLRLP